MPTAQPAPMFAPCPEGEDILVKLKMVEEVINPPDAIYNAGETRWCWIFETLEERNEEDEPYLVRMYTGPSYIPASTRCALTKLLDKICRELTSEEKENIDTDTLIGKKFKIDVTHLVSKEGRKRANIDSIKRVTAAQAATPARGKAKPAPEPKEEDDEDPFSEE